MNAASFRNTKYEISTLKQEANGWTVTYSERATGTAQTRYLHEDKFGLDGLTSMHALFEALEVKLEGVLANEPAITPEALSLMVRQASDAEIARDAAVAAKADLDAQIEARRTELDMLASSLAAPAIIEAA